VTTHQQAIVPLDRLVPEDQPRAGGKAFNCARLKQAGFPVPDGLVVCATAGAADIAGIAAHPWFDGLAPDVTFAVRSSGIDEDGEGESFAGIHHTALDVPRSQVAQAIARCRASADSREAREYRRARGMGDGRAMGVLVQCLVHPLVSGVAFTVNPVTGSADEMVINASWGLGEALVSGQVDPDEFVIDKATLDRRWSRVGEKAGDRAGAASLTPRQLAELAAMLVDIEEEYQAPQDIEWCHDGSRFWIVQSRPVTTLGATTGGLEWTRANLAEVFPDITSPQALGVFEDMLEKAERRYLGSLAAPAGELGPIVKRFYGRLYLNLSQLRRVCALSGTPAAMLLRSMGHASAIHPSDETPPARSLAVLRHLPTMLRMLWRHLRAGRVVAAHTTRTNAHLAQFSAVDPQKLPDAEVWAALEAWFDRAPEYMQTVLLFGGVVFHEAPVWRACAKAGFPFERLIYPQLAAGERSVSSQQMVDLVALAAVARSEESVARYLRATEPTLPELRLALRGTRFIAAFDRFLDAYGHRGRYEYDWSLPRYREDPTPIIQAVRAHLEDTPNLDAARDAALREYEAESVMNAFALRLSPWQRHTTLPAVRRAIRTIKQYYVWREQVRSDLVRVLERLRSWHLVLADRFVGRGWIASRSDYFFLGHPEIAAAVRASAPPQGLADLIAGRRAEQARHRQLRMPLLMRERELPALLRTAGLTGGEGDQQLTGQAVSAGIVEGDVVVVRDPGDFSRMRPGAILVAPATDPSWTPLFTLAAGVVVEVGGMLSHASTIAREYGLPALANVKRATTLLKTGERVRLDAINGCVQRLTPAAAGAREATAAVSSR
jgi:phosphohistidine swiveling domain-containing protein